VAKEAVWLYEKFGEGEYRDILGLCKVASLMEIEEKGWSLTPGAYVGVAPVEDDGVDFEERAIAPFIQSEEYCDRLFVRLMTMT
jgi:type I restriction enzyme M protein